MNRMRLRQVASETMTIIQSGSYTVPKTVSLNDSVQQCVEQSRLYSPEELAGLCQSLPPVESSSARQTEFEVHNETTLAAARRMIVEQNKSSVLALNFASAIKPGGGFLNGAQAQEESLARASALHASLMKFPEFYEENRALKSDLYTDAMILSPSCPVFRDDDDALLPEFYEVGFLTTPAVNAGKVEQNEPARLNEVLPTMRRRIEMLLAIAADQQYEHLILGAWGCGVFRNDPQLIAPMFAQALLDDPRFRGRFASVVFAVLDWSEELGIIRPFLKQFGGVLTASTERSDRSLPGAKLRPPVQFVEEQAESKTGSADEVPAAGEVPAADSAEKPEVKLADGESPAQQSLFD